jgi:hypothetical protein
MRRRRWRLLFAVVASLPVSGALPAAAAVSDHYKCYGSRQISPAFQRRNVTLADAFESTTETVKRPFRTCNPVDKAGEGIQDPTAHLQCYRTRRAPGTPAFVPRFVTVDNQFGEQVLYVGRSIGLCNPAEKDGIPSTLDVNHYKCYGAQVAPGEPRFLQRFLSLQDQFETKQTVVKRPRMFCNPVDKNGEGILDPALVLTCYGIRQDRGQSPFVRRTVQIEDQFSPGGSPVTVRVRRGSMLCVPSMVLPNPTPTPTPSPTPSPTPAPTPPYGSAGRAFLESSASLLD